MQSAFVESRKGKILYKLIAIDLDGTLLTDEKLITGENVDYLNHLSKIGYEIVVATGRGYYSARNITQVFKEPMVYISNNGNIIRHSDGHRDLAAKLLDMNDFRLIIEEGQRRELQPIIHVDHFHRGYDIILSRESIENDYFGGYVQNHYRYKEVESYLDQGIDRVLALVYPGRQALLKDFHAHVLEKYPNRFSTHVMEKIDMAEGLFEVMHPQGNKWNSIKEYAESQGIYQDQIITIGDDNNDLEMIANAGLGIAMKNGSGLIKEVADLVTERDNNQSGVSHELRKVLGVK